MEREISGNYVVTNEVEVVALKKLVRHSKTTDLRQLGILYIRFDVSGSTT